MTITSHKLSTAVAAMKSAMDRPEMTEHSKGVAYATLEILYLATTTTHIDFMICA